MKIINNLLHVTIIFLVYLLPVTQVLADDSTLQVALNIVLQNSQVIAGKSELLNIAERKTSYSAKVRLGADYAQKQTLQNASGLDARAGVGFEIPLFDDGGKSKDVATAKIELATEKDKLIAEFLNRINELTELERLTRIALDTVGFTKEQLQYYKKGQEKAIVDATSLWSFVEKVKKAEQDKFLADQKYKNTLLLVSKQYGGSQWAELQAAVNQYIVNESPTQEIGESTATSK